MFKKKSPKFTKSIIIASIFIISCKKNDDNSNLNHSNQDLTNQNYKSENSITKWTLPQLSIEEKSNLVNSVQIVFNDYYVNRLQKIKDYNYDALEEANKLNKNMSSEELLTSTMDIFRNIRDLHTGFIYPYPARCFISGFPISTKLSYDENGKNEKLVIANKLTNNPNFTDPDDVKNFNELQPLDEILSIGNLGVEGYSSDEMSSKDAIEILGYLGRGANKDAYKTRAVQKFFSRNGGYMQPPEGRFTLRIKRASDGIIVVYTFPWQSYISNAPNCATLKNSKSLNLVQNKITNNLNYNSYVLNYNKKNIEESVRDFYDSNNKDSNLNIISKIIERNGKNFALIRINSFIPNGNFDLNDYVTSRKKIHEEVYSIKNFIDKNKNNISGVIFDVRENGGGYGSFPQLIANMFTSTFVENIKVKPLVSKTNRDTFYNLEMSRYFGRKGSNDPLPNPILDTIQLMDKIIKERPYDVSKRKVLLQAADRYDGDENDSLPSDYSKENNDILKPILTNKPIAVLTNSNCFSACDVFTSIFKDYKIARIFSETMHTGGGGANVIEWADFLKPVVIDELGTTTSMIPNGKALPRGSEIRFAWNKIKRINDNRLEQYIEGVGVIADYVYKPTTDDVITKGQKIINKIMDDMIDPMNSKKFYLDR